MIEQTVVNGLLLGGVYTLVGLGFSLVWGTANVINVAHGAFIMLGAYITYWLFTLGGIDPFLALPVTAAVMFAFGYLIQRYVINLILRSGVFMTLVLTFGINILLVNLALVFWKADFRSVNPDYASAVLHVGNVVVPYLKIGVFVLALVVTGLVHLFMTRTKTGLAIKAAALNRSSAELVGIDIGRIYAVTYGLGALLAAVAGSLLGTISSISPHMGDALISKAFIIACLGGLGSITGSLAGGLTLGIVEVLGARYIGSSYQMTIGFVVLLLILILRPEGLFGRRFFAEVKGEDS